MVRDGGVDVGGVKCCNGRLGFLLHPIPPLDGLSCLAVHILYIYSKCKLFVDVFGLISAQIDGPCLQVYRLCAIEGR